MSKCLLRDRTTNFKLSSTTADTKFCPKVQQAIIGIEDGASRLLQAISSTKSLIEQSLENSKNFDADKITALLERLESRVSAIEERLGVLEGNNIPPKVYKVSEPSEEIDLFGSEDEEPAAKPKVKVEPAKKKKEVINRSSVVFDVMPCDCDTDLTAIEKLVRDIKMDGLQWFSSSFIDVAYGIKKLRISCLIEDAKVSTDDLEAIITENEDLVQCIDIVSFQKSQ